MAKKITGNDTQIRVSFKNKHYIKRYAAKKDMFMQDVLDEMVKMHKKLTKNK